MDRDVQEGVTSKPPIVETFGKPAVGLTGQPPPLALSASANF